LEQGPEKSGCFCCLLWWSVGRHGSSDLDASSFVPWGHKVISIKAHCLWGDADRLLRWRACRIDWHGHWLNPTAQHQHRDDDDISSIVMEELNNK